MKKERINVFFAVDDNYIDFLVITLSSIIDNALDENYTYNFRVLHNGLSQKSRKRLKHFNSKRFRISYFNVGDRLDALARNFKLRDYYTMTTYYRLLIPDTFFTIDKALYLDCDITVLSDLSKLYKTEIGDNLVGAIADASVQIVPEFITYVNKALKIKKERYFNAGILIMNLKEMRQTHLLKRVYELSKTTAFKVAQDQDLLNVICKDRVTYVSPSWNVMPIGDRAVNIDLIHYNLIYKPWKRKDIMYQEHFWHYAIKEGLEDAINERLAEITEEYFKMEEAGMENLKKLCLYEASHPEKYVACDTINDDFIDYKISTERREIYERIEQLEKEGKFDQDVENDPPYIPLHAGDVDYFHKKIKTKAYARFYNYTSFKYFNHQIKKGRIIIDDYVGVENLKALKTGAILTCNHFNPFDSIPLHKAVKKYHRKKVLFKVIKEGNYTFPGLFGKFMRYCNTLPLANDFEVLRQMIKSVGYWMDRGYCVLIYPEQSMWWNYRKPKPTKPGAFNFAAKFNKPVVPCFITMRQTDKLNNEGDHIQAYTLHILKPIYPNPELSIKDNMKMLQAAHDEAWKKVYEETYGIKLEYTTEKAE